MQSEARPRNTKTITEAGEQPTVCFSSSVLVSDLDIRMKIALGMAEVLDIKKIEVGFMEQNKT